MSADVQPLARLVSSLHNDAWGAEGMQSWMESQLSALRAKSIDENALSRFSATLETLKANLTDALDAITAIQEDVHQKSLDNSHFFGNGLQRLPDNILLRIFQFGNQLDTVNYWEKRTEDLMGLNHRDGLSEDESEEDDLEDEVEKNGLEGEQIVESQSVSESFINEESGEITNPFALRISHVNRRFRAVALRNPTLWSRLRAEDSLYRNRMFLNRSKDAGLTIHFSYCSHFKSFLKMVLKHRNRWTTVIFEANWDGDYDTDSLIEDYYLTLSGPWTLPRLVEIDSHGDNSMVKGPYVKWTMPNLSFLHTGYYNMLRIWTPRLKELELNNFSSWVEEELFDNHLTRFSTMSSCHTVKLGHNWGIAFRFKKDQKHCVLFPNIRLLSVNIRDPRQMKILDNLLLHYIPIQRLREIELSFGKDRNIAELTLFREKQKNPLSLDSLKIIRIVGPGDRGKQGKLSLEYNAKVMPVLEFIEFQDVAAPTVTLAKGSHFPHLKRVTYRSCSSLDFSGLKALAKTLMGASSFQRLEILQCTLSDESVTRERIENLIPGKVDFIAGTKDKDNKRNSAFELRFEESRLKFER